MTDNELREAIAQAIYEAWSGHEPASADPPWDELKDSWRPEWYAMADAVLPLVEQARREGYESGKAHGMRTGYHDGYAVSVGQHVLTERERLLAEVDKHIADCN